MNISRKAFLQGVIATGATAAFGGGDSAISFAGRCIMPPGRRLRIAHMSDPQFGFGQKYSTVEENYPVDMERFEKAIERVNDLAPDLALITGDMTHVTEEVTRDWPRLMSLFQVPVAVAPGNHDMGDKITRENLDRYLGVFGYDHKAFDLNGWRIIVGNTQYLFNTTLTAEKAEYEEWLAAELENAKSYNGRVIIAGHYPPFLTSVDESDSYHNMPTSLRRSRLEAFCEAKAKFYLCGHVHSYMMNSWRDLTMLTAEVTNFGFRMLDMYEGYEEFNWSYQYISSGAT